MKKYPINILKRSSWSYLGVLKKKKPRSFIVYALSNLTQSVKVG
jgi:hypothetical protein